MKDLSKYLGPWIKHDESSYKRYLLIKPLSFYRVWHIDFPLNKGWLYNGKGECFDTKEAAMKEADKYLIKSGYILLNEEQYEKLRILL